MVVEATVAALFVLASNTLLRPVVNRINRAPVNEETSEAVYTVYVICRRDVQADVREQLVHLLEVGSYPVRDVDHHPFGQGDAEIEATLYATAVDGAELDCIMTQLEALPGVVQAFWNPSRED